jgi:hypothetical protein
MATTQFTRATPYLFSALREQSMETQPLRMNWVVVTGKNGNRSLSMQWTAPSNC